MHPQPALRLRRDPPLHLRLALPLRKLAPLLEPRLESADPSRKQARELRLREPLPDAAPGAVQERQESVVAVRAAAVVGRAVGVEPALGLEVERVRAPERRGRVDGVGGEDDVRVFGDEVAGEGGVVRGDAHGEGHGGPEAEDLGADGVQVVAAVEGGGGYGVVWGGEVGADFGAELLLDGRVAAEEVDAPAGRGLVFGWSRGLEEGGRVH